LLFRALRAASKVQFVPVLGFIPSAWRGSDRIQKRKF
jgi:hypothetical protein